MKHRCFTAAECVNGYCPNARCDEIEEYYGVPCEDAGLSRVDCRSCYYNTGFCPDCVFYHSPDCGETENDVIAQNAN